MTTEGKHSCCGGSSAHSAPAAPNPSIAPETAIDPVCGMRVTISDTSLFFDFQDRRYDFCCQGCRTKFSTSPGYYLSGAAAARPRRKAVKARYECPMHPDVVSDKPGDCPACGMPLEASVPTADDGNAEVKELAHRFGWSALLSLPLLIVSMSEMFGFSLLPATGAWHLVSCWLQAALATPVVFYLARPLFSKALASVRSNNANMFTLLALGIGIPYAYSLVSLVFATLSGADGGTHHHMVYFESSALIATLAWLGQYLEARARHQSGSALRALVKLAPDDATVLMPDGSESRVPVKHIAPWARLRIAPGERLPVDGIVIDGRSTVDESMLTGESVPVLKETGSQVAAGTINTTGSLLVQAQQVGEDTMLSGIIRLVSDAQRSRVPIQQLADKAASIFVPAVLLVAATTAISWLALGFPLADALAAATAVLVVACPCALGLAVPMSIIVASGRAAREGVLFKEARSLQTLCRVDTLVIDKTGTLTEGKPSVQAIRPVPGTDADALLALCAAVEQQSEHPLAAAIVQAAKAQAVAVSHDCRDFQSETGLGARATVDGKTVLVGSRAYLVKHGIAVPATEDATTTVHVASQGDYLGSIQCADKLRDTSAATIAELQAAGISVILASGDSESAVALAATASGITTSYGRLLPSEKSALVERLQADGHRVAMTGDGINDAPALARSDVGIALASGTDAALHTADIVLVSGGLEGIVRARKLSFALMRNIRQNLFLAFAYNLVAIPVCAGALSQLGITAVNPVVAALAMCFSSVAVVANALRLKGQAA